MANPEFRSPPKSKKSSINIPRLPVSNRPVAWKCQTSWKWNQLSKPTQVEHQEGVRDWIDLDMMERDQTEDKRTHVEGREVVHDLATQMLWKEKRLLVDVPRWRSGRRRVT